MSKDQHAPADTRIMGIVHDALRRDLGRATSALASAPPTERATAIADHVVWMMDFLEIHHHGEDAGLWPLVRERDRRAAAQLDRLEADHREIAPRLEGCREAAVACRTDGSDAARRSLLGAIDDLCSVLLPHLDREESEMMPIVSVALTAAEWQAIDKEHFIDPKSLGDLGIEGHWLLDGLDAERAAVVVHQVPPIPRFVLLNGFRRRYRRRAEARWGAGTYGPEPALPRSIPRTGRATTVVPASIDDVWRVVADPTRVGEWSHECRKAAWVDGATAATPGARFTGTNKAGMFSWSRLNEVVAVEPGHRLVWRTISSLRYPDSSEWSIELDEVDGGTRITQSYRMLTVPPLLPKLYALVIPNHRGRSSGLTDDLRRLGELARAPEAVLATA
ncbi:MAG: hemerythrin domain-containing protein [Acidimicrobiia bacterium]|nr:hemerythrin domain-containing protein [Acidimicrobiia bacterium]